MPKVRQTDRPEAIVDNVSRTEVQAGGLERRRPCLNLRICCPIGQSLMGQPGPTGGDLAGSRTDFRHCGRIEGLYHSERLEEGCRGMRLLGFAAVVATFVMPAATKAHAQTPWEYNVTPYGWLAGLDGNLGVVPGLPSEEVSLSFGDILKDLDYGLFLFSSARNDPWVIYFDGSAVQTTSTENVGGPAIDSIKVKSRTSNLALAVGYSVASDAKYNVDGYLGARAWWLDTEITVDTQPGTGLGQIRSDSDASWVDPIVGVAGQYEASERWTLFGNAEVGGFGVGADLEWSVMAGATYAVNEWFGLTAAWRYLAVDYEDDGIVFDVSQTGPLFGATFRF